MYIDINIQWDYTSADVVRILRRITRTRTTAVYNIGAASRLTGLPIWTLRWIERHELVVPERTEGRQRLFSDADLELLDLIRELMEERVNMAGIRVILRLRGQGPAKPGGKPRSRRRRARRPGQEPGRRLAKTPGSPPGP